MGYVPPECKPESRVGCSGWAPPPRVDGAGVRPVPRIFGGASVGDAVRAHVLRFMFSIRKGGGHGRVPDVRRVRAAIRWGRRVPGEERDARRRDEGRRGG